MRTLLHTIRWADQALILRVHDLRTDWQNRWFSAITNLGGAFFQIMLIVALLLMPGTRKTGIVLGIVQITVTASTQLLKLLVARVRPYQRLARIQPLRTEKDSSFPSGHTAAVFSTVWILGALAPAFFPFGLVLAVLVGYSRIYLGVHYPSDVLAGGAIGLIITVFFRIGL